MQQDTRDRIWAAADRLFAASATNEFPKVAQVREAARASMNDVSEVMREWRQKQRTVVREVMQPLPEALHLAILEQGHVVWQTAQDLANEALDIARASFEAEKNDLTQLSIEQSQAYDQLAQDLEACRAELAQATGELQEGRQTIEEQAQQLVRLQERLGLAEARTQEIEKRADGLQSELERVHAEAQADQQKAEEQIKESRALAEEQGRRLAQLQERLVLAEKTSEDLQRQLDRERTEGKARQLKAAEDIQRLSDQLVVAGKEKAVVESALNEARQQEAVQRAEKDSYKQLVEAERAREREAAKLAEENLRARLTKAGEDGAASARAAAQYQGELAVLRDQVQLQQELLQSFAIKLKP